MICNIILCNEYPILRTLAFLLWLSGDLKVIKVT
jgi:hypothetical protein